MTVGKSNKSHLQDGPITTSSSSVGQTSRKQQHTPGSNRLHIYMVIIVIVGFTLAALETFLAPSELHSDGSVDPRPHLSVKELALQDFKGQKEPASQDFKGQKEPASQDSKGRKRVSRESSLRRQQPTSSYNQNKTVPPSSSSPVHPPYHVVFSTSCHDQMHWESYVFFYHAHKVNQPGTVTRIASGCREGEGRRLQEFHDKYIHPMNPGKYFLHMTPDYGKLTQERKLGDKYYYKYMNKPYGLRHWMENILRMNETDRKSDVEDGIVILMDPDMILLRPIVHDYTNEDVIFVKDDPDTKVVKHGYPMAQQDGYLGNVWMSLNTSYVTNGGNIDNLKQSDGPTYYNTGPPYLATVRDMYNIALLWCDYAPRVYDIHPELFAEMYGYIFATTQLNLPHTLIKSIVVSETPTTSREGWAYIDAIPDKDICEPTEKRSALPVALHYCKRYPLDHWFFSKYRLKKKYISCEAPLMKPPPADLATRNITIAYQPPPDGHSKPEDWVPPVWSFKPYEAKRIAFMLCALITKINEAAIHFKQNHCENVTVNMEYFDIFTDPND